MNSGIILLDKMPGESSAQLTTRVRKLFRANRAGHGGSLDPLAGGLLVVFLDEATPFAEFALGGDKKYRARIQFGIATDSGDGEGKIIYESPTPPNLSGLESVLGEFVGEFEQVAPLHSALKYRGKPLYFYARKGESVPEKKRRVRVGEIRLLGIDGAFADLEIQCGAGFYLRSLARDLGQRLGCGGYLASLRRLASGTLAVENAASFESLEKLDDENRKARILSAEEIVLHFPLRHLGDAAMRRIARGNSTPLAIAPGIYRAHADGEFAGLIQCDGQSASAKKLTASARRKWEKP